MTDETQATQPTDETEATQPLTQTAPSDLAPVPAPRLEQDAASEAASASADRPEIVVGAAFAAGFSLAMLLKRLVR